MRASSLLLLIFSLSSWTALLHALSFDFPPVSERASQPAPEARALDQPQFIYNGQELAAALRSSYATGNSKSAQQAVATAVIYLISQGKGDQAASLVGDAEQSLRATGDTSIADATTSSYGAAIQQTFTDTTLTVSADDVGGAVAGALLQGQGLAIATVTALGTVSTTNCPEVNTVVAAAKTTAVANGKETAFISALGNLEQIARTDSNSPAASLFSCVPNATATDVQKASKP